jgi:hypothetical protein
MLYDIKIVSSIKMMFHSWVDHSDNMYLLYISAGIHAMEHFGITALLICLESDIFVSDVEN